MIVDCFVIPIDMVAELTIKVDSCNEIRPMPISDGPDAGSFFLDEAIIVRFPDLGKKLKDKKVKKQKLDSSKLYKKIAPLQK